MTTDKGQGFSFLTHNCMSSCSVLCNDVEHQWEISGPVFLVKE